MFGGMGCLDAWMGLWGAEVGGVACVRLHIQILSCCLMGALGWALVVWLTEQSVGFYLTSFMDGRRAGWLFLALSILVWVAGLIVRLCVEYCPVQYWRAAAG